MRLPMAAVALLLLGTVLAGCSDDSEPPTANDPMPSEYVVPDVPAVDAAALLADHEAFVTEFNVREGNDPRHEGARQALTAMFESFGLEVYRHNFTEGGLDQANIVGIKWGVDRQNWVVVGGHYDTTTNGDTAEQSQGAYDDGSGTFLTVHMAKAFSAVQPYYTMAFVAYDGEERGLQGATAFVQDVVVGDESPYGDVEVVGTVDLDMIGINWPGTNAPVIVLANSDPLFEAADAKRESMGWPDDQWKREDSLAAAGMVELGSSDFAAFMAEDIPTLFLISNFIELGVPSPVPLPAPGAPAGVYPFWHQFDTVTTMRAMAGGEANLQAGFQATADVVAHTLHQLACQPGLEWGVAA